MKNAAKLFLSSLFFVSNALTAVGLLRSSLSTSTATTKKAHGATSPTPKKKKKIHQQHRVLFEDDTKNKTFSSSSSATISGTPSDRVVTGTSRRNLLSTVDGSIVLLNIPTTFPSVARHVGSEPPLP